MGVRWLTMAIGVGNVEPACNETLSKRQTVAQMCRVGFSARDVSCFHFCSLFQHSGEVFGFGVTVGRLVGFWCLFALNPFHEAMSTVAGAVVVVVAIEHSAEFRCGRPLSLSPSLPLVSRRSTVLSDGICVFGRPEFDSQPNQPTQLRRIRDTRVPYAYFSSKRKTAQR